jgi:putative spermidine/putrescine transport system permease protein
VHGPSGSRKRDWSKIVLAIYFCIFLVFIYAPLLLMGVLSLQGEFGSITFPFRGPLSLDWWRLIIDESLPGSNARAIRESAVQSLWLAIAAGAITALIAFSLSMAFRRRFRLDGAAFYLIMLALMTPGYLLALGTQLFWSFADVETSLWKTALGTNVIWGIPFGFLVMLAVWNRYDDSVEEAARDLGANRTRTFREVTLPLVWTGIFGAFLFGFTLTWNDYDRTLLLISGVETQTLPLTIAGLTFTAAIRPDLYALGSATTLFTIAVILLILVVVTLSFRLRGEERVERVEEEFGEVEAFDIESLEGTDTAGARTPS